ncbi:hypothetical protein PNEG_02991 [Pneumocystis murina B123]|uniref:Uncharacterized protein n=1 Tax=Pneumocystis murina (strain B123) TaxID=1069680 RepID=M7NIT1_PNEMU|nr:hypothetical protein PNEG_02991 [Pneumocystis murina B123]EMR08508.1 hypothetical protein PNEG_02991 [Pneumocystis murina B123]
MRKNLVLFISRGKVIQQNSRLSNTTNSIVPHTVISLNSTNTLTNGRRNSTRNSIEKFTFVQASLIKEIIKEGKISKKCISFLMKDTWMTNTSLHTNTITNISTITSTVIKKIQIGEEMALGGGMKMRILGMIKIMLLGVIVMGML